MHKAYLGLGSNIGDRKSYLVQAIQQIEMQIGKVCSVSSAYLSEPWGFEAKTYFLNIAISLNTELSPQAVLERCLRIEKNLRRQTRKAGSGYMSRTIDIDILFFDDLIIDEEGLQIPHPRIESRNFVLLPLMEIDPQFIHPVLEKSVADIYKNSKDQSRIRKTKLSLI